VTDHDPTDDQLTDLLERFALEQGQDLDPDRFREMAGQVVEEARSHPEMGRLVCNLEAHGASLYVQGCPANMLELRLGYPDDPDRWPKAHGRSVALGRFPLSRVLARPQG
jgi:hypothetical protein